MPEMTVSEVQDAVDEWIEGTDEGYFPPLSLLAASLEELGEVGREINHLEGHKTKKGEEEGEKLKEELSDLLFTVICIANFYDIDLEEGLKEVMKKYNIRDKGRWDTK